MTPISSRRALAWACAEQCANDMFHARFPRARLQRARAEELASVDPCAAAVWTSGLTSRRFRMLKPGGDFVPSRSTGRELRCPQGHCHQS